MFATDYHCLLVAITINCPKHFFKLSTHCLSSLLFYFTIFLSFLFFSFSNSSSRKQSTVSLQTINQAIKGSSFPVSFPLFIHIFIHSSIHSKQSCYAFFFFLSKHLSISSIPSHIQPVLAKTHGSGWCYQRHSQKLARSMSVCV